MEQSTSPFQLILTPIDTDRSCEQNDIKIVKNEAIYVMFREKIVCQMDIMEILIEKNCDVLSHKMCLKLRPIFCHSMVLLTYFMSVKYVRYHCDRETMTFFGTIFRIKNWN